MRKFPYTDRDDRVASQGIREGFGRGKGRDRNSALRVARGEAEETIGHLRGNYAAKRITRSVFFSLRNRLISIVKMIDGLLGE